MNRGPWPLADFEHYMLADDRGSHPMTFFVRLNLSGAVDAAALSDAAELVLARHPLLRSVLQPLPFGRECEWREAGLQPLLSAAEEAVALDFPRGEPIDLRVEQGLRIWIRNGSHSSRLWLQFHHACCDGLGAFRFIEDLLAAYSQQRGTMAADAALRPVDTTRLASREQFGQGWREFFQRIPHELVGLAGAVRFFLRRPLSLKGGKRDETPEVCRTEAYCVHQVTGERLHQLRRAAHDDDATLNDLLLRDYFLAIDDWMRQQQPQARGRTVRVMIPMNLRQAADEAIPAANLVTMEFLDRDQRNFGDAARLLAGIRDETRNSKLRGLGMRLIRVVGFIRSLGLELEPLLGEHSCLSTSVFSNLGDPLAKARLPRRGQRLVAGDLVLESIDIVPPLRPQTNVSMVAHAYAGELRFTLHYDPRSLSSAEGEHLMGAFARRLEASAACGETPLENVVSGVPVERLDAVPVY